MSFEALRMYIRKMKLYRYSVMYQYNELLGRVHFWLMFIGLI